MNVALIPIKNLSKIKRFFLKLIFPITFHPLWLLRGSRARRCIPHTSLGAVSGARRSSRSRSSALGYRSILLPKTAGIKPGRKEPSSDSLDSAHYSCATTCAKCGGRMGNVPIIQSCRMMHSSKGEEYENAIWILLF